MSGSSYQGEIPSARVNIRLNVDKGGAQKKVELPLKLLVLGDFSRRPGSVRLADREKIALDKANFDQVVESMDLSVKTAVPNRILDDGSDLPVELRIRSVRSFEPSEIVRQVPELSRLMAARNLIRDLGSNLLDNREFRKRMEGILKDRAAVETVLDELDRVPTQNKEA